MTATLVVYALAALLLWYVTDDAIALLWPVAVVLLARDLVRVAWWRFRTRKVRAAYLAALAATVAERDAINAAREASRDAARGAR